MNIFLWSHINKKKKKKRSAITKLSLSWYSTKFRLFQVEFNYGNPVLQFVSYSPWRIIIIEIIESMCLEIMKEFLVDKDSFYFTLEVGMELYIMVTVNQSQDAQIKST